MPEIELSNTEAKRESSSRLEVPSPVSKNTEATRMPPPFELTVAPARKEDVYALEAETEKDELEGGGARRFEGFFEGLGYSRFVEILENSFPGSLDGFREYFKDLVEKAGDEPDWASINDMLVDHIMVQLNTLLKLNYDEPGAALASSRDKAKERDSILPDWDSEYDDDSEFEEESSGPASLGPQINIFDPEGEVQAEQTIPEEEVKSKPRRRQGFSQQISLPMGGGGAKPRGSLLAENQKSGSRKNSLATNIDTRRKSLAPNLAFGGRRKSSVPRHEALRRDSLQTGFTRQYIDAVDKVAQLRDEVIMVRDPNGKSGVFHQAGFSSKPLNMKGKTDRLTGLIPRKQELSKAKEGGPTTLAKCQKSIDDGIAKGIYTVRTVKQIIQDATPEARKLLQSTPLGQLEKVDPSREYICDPRQRPITADYDLLGIGRRKSEVEQDANTPADQPIFNSDVGFSTPSSIGTIIDLNIQVKAAGYDGGLLFHHGAEQMNESFTQAQGKSVLFDPTKRGPETISSTDGNMGYFDEKLKGLDRKGFDVYRNQNWRDPKEHRGMAKIMADYNVLGAKYGLKEMTISDFQTFDAQSVFKQIAELDLTKADDMQTRDRIVYNLRQIDPSIEPIRSSTPSAQGISRPASPFAQSLGLPSKESLRREDITKRIINSVNELAENHPGVKPIAGPQIDKEALAQIRKEMKELTTSGSKTRHEDFQKASRVVQLLKDLKELG